MRNTLEYPVTKEEVISALEDATDVLIEKGNIGDIRPHALEKAKEWLRAHGPEEYKQMKWRWECFVTSNRSIKICLSQW